MTVNILHLSSWAQSVEKRPIELYEGKGRGSHPLLFIGGVHGDEPEGVRLAIELKNWLQKNHSEQLHSWLLIPDINPDGSTKNQRMNSRGVDLNRNFPSPDWSSHAKTERYYPGPHPESEPEVQALCRLIKERKPHLIIHFHSWEPCVVYTGAAGKKAAEILGKNTPYKISEDIGYPTPGSLGQYGSFVHQIPVICIEAQEKSNLDTVWPIFASGLQNLLQQYNHNTSTSREDQP